MVLFVFHCVECVCITVLSALSPGPVEDFFQSLSIPFDYFKVYYGLILSGALSAFCAIGLLTILEKIEWP